MESSQSFEMRDEREAEIILTGNMSQVFGSWTKAAEAESEDLGDEVPAALD